MATKAYEGISANDNILNAGTRALQGDYAGAGKELLIGVHDGLDVLGFVPVLGAAPDLINAGINAIEGDKVKRFEMTTATVGRGRGYSDRGAGQADPATRASVEGAINRKTGTHNQFNAPMDGVPAGGHLGVHMRGKPLDDAQLADVMASRQARLQKTGAEEVWFFRSDSTAVRFDVNSGKRIG